MCSDCRLTSCFVPQCRCRLAAGMQAALLPMRKELPVVICPATQIVRPGMPGVARACSHCLLAVAVCCHCTQARAVMIVQVGCMSPAGYGACTAARRARTTACAHGAQPAVTLALVLQDWPANEEPALLFSVPCPKLADALWLLCSHTTRRPAGRSYEFTTCTRCWLHLLRLSLCPL